MKKTPSPAISTLLNQCWDLMISAPAEARLLAEKAINQTGLGDIEQTDALSQLGLCYHYQGDYEKATEVLNNALSHALKHNHARFLRRISNALGMGYQALGRYALALDNYEYGIELARSGHPDELIPPMANMASLMFDMGQLESAEHYVNEVLGLDFTGVLKDNLVELYLLQARLLLSSMRFDEARLSLEQTQQLAKTLDFKYALVLCKVMHGRMLRLQGDLDEAVSYLSELIYDETLQNETQDAIGAYIELSKALFSLKRNESALRYLNECLNRFPLPANSPHRLRILEQMARGYLLLNEPEREAQCLREIRAMEQTGAVKENRQIMEIRELKRKQEQEKLNQQLVDRENKLLKESYERLSLLNDIAHQITMTLDFKQLGLSLYGILAKHMDVHFVSLLTINNSGDTLQYRFAFDEGNAVETFDIPLNKPGSNTVKAFVSKKPVVIGDIGELDPKNRVGGGSVLPKSMLFVPLILEEEILGVFSMQSPLPHRFENYELQLMMAISRFIAIATSNILSHEKVSKLNEILFDEKQAIIAAQERIQHMAYHDSLTSLPNRQALEEFIEQRMAQQAASFHLIYIDLDGFKPVNDRFGHRLGDAVLIEIGRRIKDSLRSQDFAARVGGDEFVLIMASLDNSDRLNSFLERLLAIIEEPINAGENETHVSASIGCAHFPSQGADLDRLMHSADQAMYDIKRSGKGGFKRA